MAKGYWIAHVTVADREGWQRYIDAARPAFEAHGAAFLARGGAFEEAENAMGRERHVLIEFPSFTAAQACYHSDAYQAAKSHREGAGIATVILTEGAA
ncbi:MAG: DUF1330 domain-containing protein [Pseudomonadota bacterium]